MGGANSEVTAETKTIFLEAAYFNPANIRKTAKKLALPSEAAHRFERGIDIETVLEAGERAAYLMQEYAGGELVSGVIDVYPQPYQRPEIELETEMVNNILGIELTTVEIKEMLERLEFPVEKIEEGKLKVAVPGFRSDVEREADLIEEVARIYGYNKIPSSSPESKQQGGRSERQLLEDLSREQMLSAGLDEVITFSLTGKDKYELLQLDENSRLRNWVELKNPLSELYAIMRTSMIPGILELLSSNSRRQVEKMAVFELGNVYFNTIVDGDYRQEMKLAGASMGYDKDTWNSGAPDFFYLKGVVEGFFENTGLQDYTFQPGMRSYLHPGRTAELLVNGEKAGFIGEVLPEIIEEMDLVARTTVFQLDFDKLSPQMQLKREFVSLPKYPAVERDLAVVVNKEISAGEILRLIQENTEELLKKVELFDIYEGDQIPGDSRSLAFKLLFQAEDRTLKDKEVNQVFDKLLGLLEEKFQAKIRGI